MKATNQECRWRFSSSIGGDGSQLSAWETSCGQFCTETESTPDREGFRNGFCFCPYCGGSLLLVLRPHDLADNEVHA